MTLRSVQCHHTLHKIVVRYRHHRLERQVSKFLEELEKIQDDFLKEELMLYMQSLQ